MSDLRPSISIIVPTWQGARRLPRLLSSLKQQTIGAEHFEVIFVINGPDDGSKELLQEFGAANPHLNTRIYLLAEAGAGIARNVGIATARRSHITFVDDDDYLQPKFLAEALRLCGSNQIGLLPMVDEVDGEIMEATSINARMKTLRGTSLPLASAPWVLGFNSCKVMPADIVCKHRYDPFLRSGEDVAFFANFLRYRDLELVVSSARAEAAYVRVQRPSSVSRRDESFDFSVTQRLDVIRALQRIPLHGQPASARDSLVRSQFDFTERYLRSRPDEVEPAIDEAINRGIRNLSWAGARGESTSKRLVISFCFPPYADPAANVTAKRIAEMREPVDVVCADMSPVRREDSTSMEIARPWVNSVTKIGTYPAFSAWPLITEFAEATMRAVGSRTYRSIYSRAMWSGSHVAALLYKERHPGTHWEAEFSDPMRFDASGAPRAGEITPGPVTEKLRRIVTDSEWVDLVLASHFELTEAATLIAADEVTFSNGNQKELVLDQYPASFRRMVEVKSRVASQPIPPAAFYNFRQVDVNLIPGAVNIGYFGNFYRNRGLGTLTEALSRFPVEDQERFALHIFSSNAKDVEEAFEESGIVSRVEVHPPLPYLEFLSAAKQFEALLVVDAATRGSSFLLNPFLPSKYSDYAGSGAPIWAIVEEGSPLSSSRTDYRSQLNDVEETKGVLARLLSVQG